MDITRKNIYPRFILRVLEKKILKNANKIIYVSPFTLKQQQNLFPSFKTKMMFLPPAYAISSHNQQNNKKTKVKMTNMLLVILDLIRARLEI